ARRCPQHPDRQRLLRKMAWSMSWIGRWCLLAARLQKSSYLRNRWYDRNSAFGRAGSGSKTAPADRVASQTLPISGEGTSWHRSARLKVVKHCQIKIKWTVNEGFTPSPHYRRCELNRRT